VFLLGCGDGNGGRRWKDRWRRSVARALIWHDVTCRDGDGYPLVNFHITMGKIHHF
jgi:hypothetical protein